MSIRGAVSQLRLTPLLFFYIARQFLLWFGAVMLLFIVLIFMIDTIELLRRSSGKPNVSFTLVLEMSAMKLPFLIQATIPFAVLFGGMMAFWRLNRSSELVSIRAAGVSVWQFLAPAITMALIIGVLRLMALNPVASLMYARWEQLENHYLKGRSSVMAVSNSGVWLRQVSDRGHTVIHAASVARQRLELHRVMVIHYEGEDRFAERIDASKAVLRKGYWELTNALVYSPTKGSRKVPTYRLKTDLTLARIQESFSSPETISFWELPRFIRELEKAGFSAISHRLHYHSLTAEPLLLCAMILVGAVFSLRHNRKSGAIVAISGGIITGFTLFFVSKVILNLGGSGSLPVILAAWIPAGACAMLGLTALLHLEDG